MNTAIDEVAHKRAEALGECFFEIQAIRLARSRCGLFEAVSFVRPEEKRPPCEIDAVAFQLLSYFFHKLSVRIQ